MIDPSLMLAISCLECLDHGIHICQLQVSRGGLYTLHSTSSGSNINSSRSMMSVRL